MKTIIIGSAGHWHLVKASRRAQVVAIAPGYEGEDLSGPAQAFPEARVYASRNDITEAFDVAVVNSRFDLNGVIAADYLKQGADIYCEKPLAATHAVLDALEQAWRASGRKLGGMFNYRFSPWFLAMQQAAEEGLIGELRQIHAQKSYRMGQRPDFYKHRETMTGLIPWVAIHAVDWALAFGGKCRWVSASHSRQANRSHGDMEATSALLMQLEGGVIATVTADYLRPSGSARHDDDRLRLTGTRGMMEVIDGRVYLENEAPRRELPLPQAINAFDAFLDGLTTAEDALYATHISLCARDAADEHALVDCT